MPFRVRKIALWFILVEYRTESTESPAAIHEQCLKEERN